MTLQEERIAVLHLAEKISHEVCFNYAQWSEDKRDKISYEVVQLLDRTESETGYLDDDE